MCIRDSCNACHEENGIEIAAAECAKCHGKDMARVTPSSHAADWRKAHGNRSKEDAFKKHGMQCTDCHGQTPCMTCHQNRRGMSHKLHTEEYGADECTHCHRSTEGALPTVATSACSDCHEGEPQTKNIGLRAAPLGIKFTHNTHEGTAECIDCHKATVDGSQKATQPVMTYEGCFKCHEENGIEIAATDCAKCHGKDMARVTPASHAGDWCQVHGERSKEDASKKHGKQCTDCHGQTPCMSCHQNRRAMSHKLHTEEYGADECTYCHRSTEGALPTVATSACSDCHEGTPQTTDIGPRALRMTIKFLHGTHEGAAGCIDCHQATVDGTQKETQQVLTCHRGFDCHKENGIKISKRRCVLCHGEAKDRIEPASHNKAWLPRHGKAAEWRYLEDHGDDCFLCHKKRECVTCHLTRRPKDHTGLWRMRMHGVAASFNRDRCRQCHQTGTCISCHRRTKPLYHRGAWGAAHGMAARVKSTEKCTVCHSRGWCARCHSGAK